MAKTKPAAVFPKGLGVKALNTFLSSLKNQLGNAIAVKHLQHNEVSTGSRTLYYLRMPVGVLVRGLPAIPLAELEASSTWLVVELEFERGINQPVLVHTSLKLYAGPTSDAAKLYFRAEWDARDNPNGHAQPHWNIHDVAWTEPLEQAAETVTFDMLVQKDQPTFTDLLNPAMQETPQATNANDALLSDMKKFHFAMSALWQDKTGGHAHAVDSEEKLKNWVAGCAGYIKSQIAHIHSKA